MELMGRKVRIILAQCDQVRDLKVLEGLLLHASRDKLLVDVGGKLIVIDRGYVISIEPVPLST